MSRRTPMLRYRGLPACQVCRGTQWNMEIIAVRSNIKKYGGSRFPDDRTCSVSSLET